MHRELYDVYVTGANGDVVVVELALQGTHDGPLWLPQGILPPTGNRMDAPCCDVFRLKNGKIQLFDCYPSGTVILGQLGVLETSTPRCRRTRRRRIATVNSNTRNRYLMTSEPIRDPLADHLLTPHNAAFVFIDYQPEQFATVRSIDPDLLLQNAVSTVKTVKTFDMPSHPLDGERVLRSDSTDRP